VPELAAEREVGEDGVTEILRHTGQPLSLSEPLREEGDAELGDLMEDRSAVSPFDAAAATLLSGEVERMLLALDERERQILRLRFGLDRGEARTLDQVGEYFSLSRERIRQIEDRALFKLRHPSTDRDPRELFTGYLV
jgi:RNA polymerase sigma factor (sigma-70 family)